jgi:flagellum-specific ATP synthase
VLASVSRLMNDIVDENHMKMAQEIKKVMAVYRDAEDLINVGAYSKGSNPEIDHAIDSIGRINGFLTQQVQQRFEFDEILEIMGKVLDNGAGI